MARYKQTAATAYRQLLEAGGGRRWNRSKLMLVGEGCAGKTSTLRCLMGRAFNAAHSSTIGCATNVCRVDRSEVRDWREYEGLGTGGGEYERKLAELALDPRNGIRTSAQGGDVPGSGAASPNARATRRDGGKLIHSIVERAVDRLSEDFIVQAGRDGSTNSIVLSTWDYGGQQVFYSVHHLFLTRNGAYLIVFNMARLLATNSRLETLNYLTFWLNSVHAHADGAIVILVGTHADIVSTLQQHQEISAIIDTTFASSPALNNVTRNRADGLCFYPLDNQRPLADNAAARRLSATILECVSASECVQREVGCISVCPDDVKIAFCLIYDCLSSSLMECRSRCCGWLSSTSCKVFRTSMIHPLVDRHSLYLRHVP